MATVTAAPAPNPTPDSLISQLRTLLGERLSTSAAVREQHGRDESFHEARAPDAVAFVESTEEAAEVVRCCAAHGTPVIPFGTGTSLEGHVAALHGGICIDLSRMNAILEVNAEDMDCRVQAGVTRKQLNTHLRDSGLFFPIDPGADASLGGMTATRASGTNAVRYGTMRENVLGLTVVMADARVVRTGGRARKSAAGYDLTRLMVGSEGTLGIITEVQLRLYGVPEAMSSAVCSFESLEGAVQSVIIIIQSGIPVARIELLDEVQMDAINRYSGLDYPVKPTLFFEFHGTASAVQEQASSVGEIVREFGGGDFQWTDQAEQRSKLWQARHDAYYAALALKPGSKGWATDVCVPISRLAECILETRKDIDEAGLIAPIVGHVGDGNFHLVFLVDPDRPQDIERAAQVNDRMVIRAIDMGGTCTGEHGVGYGKMAFLEREHGDALAVMRMVKKALDPQGIMNPGKIVTP
jgi:D-lactate dehydrogenase (cytochrome)